MVRKIRFMILLLAVSFLGTACNEKGGGDERPENQNPVCAITEPSDGDIITITEGLAVRGTFSDPDGEVVKVMLEVGDVQYYDIAVSPFVYNIKPGELSLGELTILLEVTDDRKGKASQTITVTIEEEMDESMFVDRRDGNRYQTVVIGTQTWMAENLRYLPEVGTDISQSDPRYYVRDYSGTNVEDAKESPYYETYGVYYNFFAALAGGTPDDGTSETGFRGICPEGWHLPSNKEWVVLKSYIEDNMLARDAYGKPIQDATAKAVCADSGWIFPADSEVPPKQGDPFVNQEDNNVSGFNGLAAGFYLLDKQWWHEGITIGWWSTMRSPAYDGARPVRIWSNSIYLAVGQWDISWSCGLNVRCLKDS